MALIRCFVANGRMTIRQALILSHNDEGAVSSTLPGFVTHQRYGVAPPPLSMVGSCEVGMALARKNRRGNVGTPGMLVLFQGFRRFDSVAGGYQQCRQPRNYNFAAYITNNVHNWATLALGGRCR